MIVFRENRFVFLVLLAVFSVVGSEKPEDIKVFNATEKPIELKSNISKSAVGVPEARNGSIVEGTAVVLPSGNSTANNATNVVYVILKSPPGNVTTQPSNSTEPEEPTVTEKIRTIIEDSVTTVKTAISKIGHFIGDLFDDKKDGSGAHNGTVTPATPATPGPSKSINGSTGNLTFSAPAATIPLNSPVVVLQNVTEPPVVVVSPTKPTSQK